MFLRFSNEFHSPDTPTGGGTSAQSSASTLPEGKEDTIDFLAEDEPSEPEKLDLTPKTKSTKDELDEKDEKDETDESEDELKELEEELAGPKEEKLELVTPVRRKEILAKYPNLFKDFPYLENAYYREQQFTEILGTIEDARTAASKADILDRFEAEILGGSTENVLKAVKNENPEGFNKLVDDYLPTLARVDENAYMHLLGNITKHTIVAMVKEARSSGNDVLQNAAAILNQFVFGTTNFTPAKNLSKQNPQEQAQNEQVNQRELMFVQQQFESTNGDINTRVNNTLKNTVEAHIDPRGTMSEYVKKKAIGDAMDTLAGLMEKDTRFRTLTDKLWEQSFKENFSAGSRDRIRSAFLAKAKTLLPSVIKKARNDALRGTGHRVTEETTPNKGPIVAGKPRSQTPGKIREAKDIPKKMSTLEFLNSD